MNPINEDPTRSDAAELDRLVDGELSDEQRREMLLQLERQPEGWRRCAMAFLEAQSWRQELGAMARPASDAASRPAPAARAQRPLPWWRRHGPMVLAAAASFLLAFWVSNASRTFWQGNVGGSRPEPQIAAKAGPSEPGVEQPAAPWRMVTFDVPDGGGVRNVRLPAVEQDRLDDAWLRSVPGPIPNDLRRALERTGHQVSESRRLMPVPMQDGRRLVVPVDQVEVRYVGNAAYQ